MGLKTFLLKMRSASTAWLPERSMAHLRAMREFELQCVVPYFPPGARVLEIGAGAGWQAARLSELGHAVEAVDVEGCNYREHRVFPVRTFDGRTLPFGDSTFDCVFTSNVVEHVRDADRFHRETQRVLKPDGVAVHVVPSGSWTLWTMLAYPLRYWRFAPRHGEHALFAAQEVCQFSRGRWRRAFEASGWAIVQAFSVGLFYTGVSLLDHHLSIAARRHLAKVLGSGCHAFVLRVRPRARPPSN